MRKNIFLWKREERSEDANEASYDLGPPQSKGPAALGGGCGEGGLPLLQLVSLQRGVGWESAKHSLECIKLQHKAALLSERTQSSFLLLSTVNIYIYILVSIDYKSLIPSDPPPWRSGEDNARVGPRGALGDTGTMASLVQWGSHM